MSMNELFIKVRPILLWRNFFLFLILFQSYPELRASNLNAISKEERFVLDSIRAKKPSGTPLVLVVVNPYDCINCNSVLYNINKRLDGQFTLYIYDYNPNKIESFRKRYNINPEVLIYASVPLLDSISNRCFPHGGERSGIICHGGGSKVLASTFKNYNSNENHFLSFLKPKKETLLSGDDFFYYSLTDFEGSDEGALYCSFEPDAVIASLDKSGRVNKTVSLTYDLLDSLFIGPYYESLADSLEPYNTRENAREYYETHVKNMGIQVLATNTLFKANSHTLLAFGHVLIPYVRNSGLTLSFHGMGIVADISIPDLNLRTIYSYDFNIDGFYGPLDRQGVTPEFNDSSSSLKALNIGLMSYNDTLFQGEFISSIWTLNGEKIIFKELNDEMVIDTNFFKPKKRFRYQSLQHFSVDDEIIAFVNDPVIYDKQEKAYAHLEPGLSGFDQYKNIAMKRTITGPEVKLETVEAFDNFVFYTVRSSNQKIISRTMLCGYGEGMQYAQILDDQIILVANPKQGTTELIFFQKQP